MTSQLTHTAKPEKSALELLRDETAARTGTSKVPLPLLGRGVGSSGVLVLGGGSSKATQAKVRHCPGVPLARSHDSHMTEEGAGVDEGLGE